MSFLGTRAVAVTLATALGGAGLLGAAGPAAAEAGDAADVEPTPVACQVQQIEAAAEAARVRWSVTCSARRNVWVGIDYYSDEPHTVQSQRWMDGGTSWTGRHTLPVDPPLRQVCVTVVESGRWVIGHTCDTR